MNLGELKAVMGFAFTDDALVVTINEEGEYMAVNHLLFVRDYTPNGCEDLVILK